MKHPYFKFLLLSALLCVSVGLCRAEDSGGIRENVPAKYQARYAAWKTEFLATATGREQWAAFQNAPEFTLTLTVARDNAQGAGTGQYKWNDKGRLIAATISLGHELHKGYPNPVYYPVMNSLANLEFTAGFDENLLAATKIAHEFGHLRNAAGADAVLFQLQNDTMPLYNKIFLSNGRSVNDKRLLELAGKMGGTPVEIWEDREYWGEANAMLFLRERLTQAGPRCAVFRNIKQRVDLYAKNYTGRFADVASALPTPARCGW
jgi:hypothetical protein